VRVHASPAACMAWACVGRPNTISCSSRSPEGRATATRLVGLQEQQQDTTRARSAAAKAQRGPKEPAC
jgi:hypothetical protein